MDQPASPTPWRAAPLQAGILVIAATGSAVAHMVAAASSPEAMMAWWMAAMGVACLACAVPMMRAHHPGTSCTGQATGQATGRAAAHLLAMTASMILIHVVLLLGTGAGSHHGTAASASSTGHQQAMLSLIGAELLCLMAASVVLRLARRTPPRTRGPAVHPAVVPH